MSWINRPIQSLWTPALTLHTHVSILMLDNDALCTLSYFRTPFLAYNYVMHEFLCELPRTISPSIQQQSDANKTTQSRWSFWSSKLLINIYTENKQVQAVGGTKNVGRRGLNRYIQTTNNIVNLWKRSFMKSAKRDMSTPKRRHIISVGRSRSKSGCVLTNREESIYMCARHDYLLI